MIEKEYLKIYQEIKQCSKCNLSRHTSSRVTMKDGTLHTPLMFIGEGPGETEEKEENVFVGRSGILLNKVLQRYKISRSKIWIENIVKCRPQNNRAPVFEEIEACSDYLMRTIYLIKPKTIITL